jgi:hypothetical protein
MSVAPLVISCLPLSAAEGLEEAIGFSQEEGR